MQCAPVQCAPTQCAPTQCAPTQCVSTECVPVCDGADVLSECAQATTSAESRFRLDRPNSMPRTVSVIALDVTSEPIVEELRRRPWGRARFHRAADLVENGPLVHEVASVDLVVMVAGVGHDLSSAALIGRACRQRRVATSTLVVVGPDADHDDTARTLAALRPYSDMLVGTSSADCFADILAALRA